MRKITKLAVQSFLDRKEFQLSNTRVEADGGESKLILFNRIIAVLDKNDNLLVSLGGYHYTRTTQERLNGLPGVYVNRRMGQTLLNDEAWDGKFIIANKL